MGSGQSARQAHFQHPDKEVDQNYDDEERYISVSNKMVKQLYYYKSSPYYNDIELESDRYLLIFERVSQVEQLDVERLVEDASLAGGTATVTTAATPRGDHKDNILVEKLKSIDDKHSERFGITIEDLNATAARIEKRAANMMSPEPVCEDCEQQVIDCYGSSELPRDFVKCWDTVDAFSKCVQDTGAARLRAHTHKEARELARRSRHVAHAREHALRDLGPPPDAAHT